MTKTKKKTKTNTKIKTKKVNNNYKKLYQQIYNAIPKQFFVNKDGLEDCAVAIYLTAMGVRPACAPFDGEVRRGGMAGNEMFEKMTKSKIGKASLNKLNKTSSQVEPLIGLDLIFTMILSVISQLISALNKHSSIAI